MAFNYYPPTRTNTEIDLRTELTHIIDGDPEHPDMIPHGSWIILRKLRRLPRTELDLDYDGKPIPGWEVDPVTKEPDMVFKNPNVTKAGYLYDDHLLKAYVTEVRISSLTESLVKQGTVNDNLRIIYLDYRVKPEYHDQVFIPRTHQDGTLISPLIIDLEFFVTDVVAQKLDGSRIEFYRCMLEQQR